MTSSRTDLLRPGSAGALAVWAAARDAGRCSADDVLSTLGEYAQVHEYAPGGGTLELLSAVSRAAHLVVRLPAPGDPQGLPPGRATDAAMAVGEVLVVDDRPAPADGPAAGLALIPRGSGERCRWEAIRYSTPVAVDALSVDEPLGEIEYRLRGAIGDAANLLSGLGGGRRTAPAEVREAVGDVARRRRIDLPPHDDPRVDRVLASADRVEAIVVLAGRGTLGDSGGELAAADTALRELAELSRRARAAALNAVIVGYRR
ncbi:hypothetical protein [Gordonia shandongensis]|uniref:hypothetical protein n=1 Tax=Gordonia shandongensis TaxID=376351 RepID=UPI00042506B6|nr:hypothetical protein [Gordonia shandongensis]